MMIIDLVKIIVLLSINHVLTSKQDRVFQDLIESLQEIDPLEQFLGLVADYDFYCIVEGILAVHGPASKIFAGNALLRGIESDDHKLVDLLLRSCCPLDATMLCWCSGSQTFRDYTALELAAVSKRNIKFTKLLLEAGANPYEGGHYFALYHICREWREPELSELDLALVQCLLDAHITRFQNDCEGHWSSLIAQALRYKRVYLCSIILRSLVQLVPFELRSAYELLIAATFDHNELNIEDYLAQAEQSKETFKEEKFC